jgi:hypothetical protein
VLSKVLRNEGTRGQVIDDDRFSVLEDPIADLPVERPRQTHWQGDRTICLGDAAGTASRPLTQPDRRSVHVEYVEYGRNDFTQDLLGVELAGQRSADFLDLLGFPSSLLELGKLECVVDSDGGQVGDALEQREILLRIGVRFVSSVR